MTNATRDTNSARQRKVQGNNPHLVAQPQLDCGPLLMRAPRIKFRRLGASVPVICCQRVAFEQF